MFAVLIYWGLVNAVANVIQVSLVTVLLLFKNCKDYKNLYTDVTYCTCTLVECSFGLNVIDTEKNNNKNTIAE